MIAHRSGPRVTVRCDVLFPVEQAAVRTGMTKSMHRGRRW